MVSGAAKIEKTQVLFGGLGVEVLQSWKLNLNVPPLSPAVLSRPPHQVWPLDAMLNDVLCWINESILV